MTKKRQKKSEFPPGWDEERVRKVLAHYEGQSDEDTAAEDEAAFGRPSQTIMKCPASSCLSSVSSSL